jgi:hypothetical protein
MNAFCGVIWGNLRIPNTRILSQGLAGVSRIAGIEKGTGTYIIEVFGLKNASIINVLVQFLSPFIFKNAGKSSEIE